MPASSPRFVLAGLFVLLVSGSSVYAFTHSSGPTASVAKPIDGIRCDPLMQPALHFHVHLDVFLRGRQMVVPAQVGISTSGSCVYWLHTHDASGVIHVEAPATETARVFTLGQFLDLWGRGPGLAGAVAIVDGKPYAGDVAGIALRAHELITLEVGSPRVPQPDFHFHAGL